MSPHRASSCCRSTPRSRRAGRGDTSSAEAGRKLRWVWEWCGVWGGGGGGASPLPSRALRSIPPCVQVMQEKAAQRLLAGCHPPCTLVVTPQVMQEKAAQRLLAQTLHQQMLEELRNNPQLAADPEQQLQFRRRAQHALWPRSTHTSGASPAAPALAPPLRPSSRVRATA